jgi:hypothetical protein
MIMAKSAEKLYSTFGIKVLNLLGYYGIPPENSSHSKIWKKKLQQLMHLYSVEV